MSETKKNKQKPNFISIIQRVGQYIIDFFLLQFLFLLNTLRGGVIFGFFPAIGSNFNYMFKEFINKDQAPPVTKEFNSSWKKHFKLTNQIGYSILLAVVFIYMDLRLNEKFIQSSILHTLLLIVLALMAFITIYTFTILIGHSLSYKAIFKQSFFVALSSPSYTIAALIGLILMYEFLKFFNFLAIFFGAPLLILPIAWFTFSGLQKIEEMKKDESYK